MITNASLIDYSLDDIIKVDYYRLKTLKTLEKLVQEEYRLQNYGLSSKYALTFLKLYKRLIRDYQGDKHLRSDYIEPQETDNTMKELKYLSAKYLDRVINTYMNCRSHLVGKQALNLIYQINEYLPFPEQWDAYTNYDQIYEADSKWGDSNYRQTLTKRYIRFSQKLLKQYEYLEQFKTKNQYEKFLA